MGDHIRIISADSHVTIPKERVYAHLPAKLREKVESAEAAYSAAMLEAKGLKVVEDLLTYAPFRYEDRSNVKTIRDLAPGEMATVLAEQAAAESWPYVTFLDHLLEEEASTRLERAVAMRTNLARFPFLKTLDQFDFGFQPSLDERQLRDLASLRFVAHAENLIFLGPPGVGKTHLAVAVGLAVIAQGQHVHVLSAGELTTLTAEQMPARLQALCKPKSWAAAAPSGVVACVTAPMRKAMPVSTSESTPRAPSTTSRSLPVNALTRRLRTMGSPGNGSSSSWIWVAS